MFPVYQTYRSLPATRYPLPDTPARTRSISVPIATDFSNLFRRLLHCSGIGGEGLPATSLCGPTGSLPATIPYADDNYRYACAPHPVCDNELAPSGSMLPACPVPERRQCRVDFIQSNDITYLSRQRSNKHSFTGVLWEY